jgi:hypothetical protein
VRSGPVWSRFFSGLETGLPSTKSNEKLLGKRMKYPGQTIENNLGKRMKISWARE